MWPTSVAAIGRPSRTRNRIAWKYSGLTARVMACMSTLRDGSRGSGMVIPRKPPDVTNGSALPKATSVTPAAVTRSRDCSRSSIVIRCSNVVLAGIGTRTVSRPLAIEAAIGVEQRDEASRQEQRADEQHARHRHLAGHEHRRARAAGVLVVAGVVTAPSTSASRQAIAAGCGTPAPFHNRGSR